MVRRAVTAKVPNSNADIIKAILKKEPDFNRALDLVVPLLAIYDPWRVEKYGKDVLSISEILHLYNYHRSIWGDMR